MEQLSLVQEPNWSISAEGIVNSVLHKAKSRTDLICLKHKTKKSSLLLHEIEGFIIEESNVPFKEEETEDVPELQKIADITQNGTELLEENEEDKENEIMEASINSYPEDKDELMSLLPTKCKYCRGELPEDRAMWGKRFCSVSCCKKYSLTCSKRVRKVLHRRTVQTSGPGRGQRKQREEEFYASPSPVLSKKGRGRGRHPSTSTPPHIPGARSPDTSHPSNSGYESSDLSDFHFTFPPRFPLGYGLDEIDIENELYEGVEPITHYSFIPVFTWSIDKVVEYISSIPGCENCAHAFAEEEIDGRALLLLKIEHMIHAMNLKLGPALKIASNLRDMKLEHGIRTRTKYLSSPL